MLLHNQTMKPLQWEADGTTYKWEPHGSCEVPDKWSVNLKDQGFPVGPVPVPPQRRAEQAATEQAEALARSELLQLKSKLADAEARAAAAAKEAQASQAREEKAIEALKGEQAAHSTTKEQLRLAKSDAAEFEKMCGEESTKREAAEKQVQSLKARAEIDKPAKK